jgi:hypothetical protein
VQRIRIRTDPKLSGSGSENSDRIMIRFQIWPFSRYTGRCWNLETNIVLLNIFTVPVPMYFSTYNFKKMLFAVTLAFWTSFKRMLLAIGRIRFFSDFGCESCLNRPNQSSLNVASVGCAVLCGFKLCYTQWLQISHFFFKAPEVCLAAFLGMLGVARVTYAYVVEEKATGYYSNRPYKRYYTVYRYYFIHYYWLNC